MKILALDTATENCSAALFINGALLAREELLERGHAQRILPLIHELLQEAGLDLPALDAIAFGRGPGAFTGVRLAASVTQGLAFGAQRPVVPVSDLRALAQRALQDSGLDRVLVGTDARMQEVYCGAFERGPGGLAVAVGPERVSPPQSVRLPQEWAGGPKPLAVGSGFAAYPPLRAAMAADVQGFLEALWPRALEIALLALPEVAAGRARPPEEALPVYLREDVAQPPRPGLPRS